MCRFTHALLIQRPDRDENEESDNIRRASLSQSNGTKVSLESPVHSDIREFQSPSSDPEEDVTHGEPGRIETPYLVRSSIFLYSHRRASSFQQKRKLRRPSRKQQAGKKTDGSRKSSEPQQPAAKARMPRRLPVDELQLVPDRVPFNPICDSDS